MGHEPFSLFKATYCFCPAPQPKPFLGYGAYRLVMVGAVAHVIGPKGKTSGQLTAWARDLLTPKTDAFPVAGARRSRTNHDPLADTRRISAAMNSVRVLLDAINWVHPTSPTVVDDLLNPKPTKAREIMLYWLRLRGCQIQPGRGQNGGKMIIPYSVDEQSLVSVTVTRFRQLFAFWADAGLRVGHNPMQMDPSRSRLGKDLGRQVKRARQRAWVDVDSLFRTRHIERQAPRPGDPEVALKVLERGRQRGWPEEVYLKFQGMYLTGARGGQMDAATAYGLLVAAKDDRHLALIQKGSNGSLAWQAITPPGWRAAVLKMLGRRVDGGVKTLLRWAKSTNEIDHARLRRLFIFSEDGVAPTPTWKSSHLLRQAVESLGLRFKIRRDDGKTVDQWFTGHWFRHTFVNRMLDAIAASSADSTTRDRARLKLAEYMGWNNPEQMLVYYGRQHYENEADLLVMSHQDDLNTALVSEFDEQADWFAANDNAMIPVGRAAGSDLLD